MHVKSVVLGALILLAIVAGGCGQHEPQSVPVTGSTLTAMISSIATSTTSSSPIPVVTASHVSPPAIRAPGEVRREDFGEKWPLTVDAGIVRCNNGAVTFASGGVSYDVNGTAMTRNRGRKIDEIWAANPTVSGLKIDISPILDLGLKLC